MFRYRACREDGHIVEGILDLSTEEDVVVELYAQGLTPIRIEKRTSKMARKISLPHTSSNLQWALAMEQLSLLLQSGLSLTEGLNFLCSQWKSGAISSALRILLQRLRAGQSMNEALSYVPHVPQLVRIAFDLGTTTAELGSTLHKFSEILHRKEMEKRRLQGILFYPIILLFVAFAVFIFMTSTVLPMFEDLWSQSAATLPLLTRVVFSFGRGFSKYWWVILILGLCLGVITFFSATGLFGIKAYRRIRSIWPLRTLLQNSLSEDFCETVGSLLASGMPLSESLKVLCEMTSHPSLKQEYQSLYLCVLEGKRLSDSFVAPELFSETLFYFLRNGEETGGLDEILVKAAKYYEKDVILRTEQLLRRIEPVSILLIGFLIGLFVLAIGQPMFDLLTVV